jgi:hypothetical protein
MCEGAEFEGIFSFPRLHIKKGVAGLIGNCAVVRLNTIVNES